MTRLHRILHRLRWLLGAIAAAELATGVAVATLAGRSTPVSVDDAVARFRATRPSTVADATTAVPTTVPGSAPTTAIPPAATTTVRATGVGPDDASPGNAGAGHASPTSTSPPASAPSAGFRPPEEGVYVYATRGGEELDVSGARHDYPAETTVTVTRTDCGTRIRWQPLRERWDERDTCPAPSGELLRGFRSHHEFFGHGDERAFTCEPGSLARPVRRDPGTTWSNRCRSGRTVATTTGRIVGPERMTVGSAAVETVHFTLASRIEGDGTGTARYEVWVLWDTGLIARQVGTVDSTRQGPVGTVRYRESFDIRLTSLTPRR